MGKWKTVSSFCEAIVYCYFSNSADRHTRDKALSSVVVVIVDQMCLLTCFQTGTHAPFTELHLSHSGR